MSTRQHRQASDGEISMNPNGSFSVHKTGANEDPHSVAFARIFLIVVNVLTTMGGLALLSMSVYAYIQFTSLFSGLLSEMGIIGGMIGGLLFAFVSLIGVFGATTNNDKALIVYVLIQFALLVTILSILGIFVDYIKVVSTIASEDVVVHTQSSAEVNDFFLSSYTKCCLQSPSTSANPGFCASPVPGTEGHCEPVIYCKDRAAGSTVPCYILDYGAAARNPPKLVADEFCGTLIAAGIVGPASSETGACGGGSAPDAGPGSYLRTVLAFVTSNVQFVYYGVGFLSALTLMEMIAAVYHLAYTRYGLACEGGRNRAAGRRNRLHMGGGADGVAVAVAVPVDTFEFGADHVEEERRQKEVWRSSSRLDIEASAMAGGSVRMSGDDMASIRSSYQAGGSMRGSVNMSAPV